MQKYYLSLLKMGNAAGVNKIPKDVTKVTVEQLDQMINSAIINNPWNPEQSKTDEEKLHSTIRSMRKRGMRPITPEEYAALLQRNHQFGHNLKIHLWKRLEDNTPRKAFGLDTSLTESEGSSGDEDGGSAASSLPTTCEEAAQIFRDFADNEDKVDTSSETVAWAANLHAIIY